MSRSMSYRKPVPMYIPSPPPSPSISFKDTNGEDANDEEEVPPLPENWRDVLNARILEVKSSRLSLATRVACSKTSEENARNVNEMDITELSSSYGVVASYPTFSVDPDSLATAPISATPPPIPPKQPSRGLPTQYRPPTPPLRSQPKRQQSQSNFFRNEGLYPPGLFFDGFQAPRGSPSLRHSPSFRTERTMVSTTTLPITGPWSHSFGTLSEGGMYSYPSRKKRSTDVVSLPDEEAEAGDILCCSNSKGFVQAIWTLATTCWSSK